MKVWDRVLVIDSDRQSLSGHYQRFYQVTLQVKVGIGNPFSPFRLAAMPKVMLVHAGIHRIFLEKQNSTMALPCQNPKKLWMLTVRV